MKGKNISHILVLLAFLMTGCNFLEPLPDGAYTDENIELYRILLTDHASSGYFQNEINKLRKILEQLIKPSVDNKIKISFLANGILGTFINYITLATGTAEENIKILTDLTLSNLRHVSYSR